MTDVNARDRATDIAPREIFDLVELGEEGPVAMICPADFLQPRIDEVNNGQTLQSDLRLAATASP